MKPNIRIIWMKLHAYLACFFIPVTFLYIITGVLYLFNIEGGVQEEFEYSLALKGEFPHSEIEARELVLATLSGKEHPRLPVDYYPDENLHDWYGYKQEILLIDEGVSGAAKLIVKEHDLWHQLLLIHKGHAGLIFTLFGIFLGGSLFFSLGSGLLLVFQLPRMKKASLTAFSTGLILLILCFLSG